MLEGIGQRLVADAQERVADTRLQRACLAGLAQRERHRPVRRQRLAGASQGEKSVVPDPPHYTACIAHLAEVSEKTTKTKPPTAQLKSQCEQQFKALQQEVLGFLTSSAWVLGEAKSLGVKASDKEVRSQFQKVKDQQFKKPAEFEKFLATSGQTVSDLLLRVKLNMLSQKIGHRLT